MGVDWLGSRVTVQVEAPRGSFVKRAPDGRVDVVSPVPCPFNYGFVPGEVAGDGDPLDAIILGRRLAVGWTGSLRVFGVVDFVDAGCADPKLVCSQRRPNALQRAAVCGFFWTYVPFKRALAFVRGAGNPTRVRGIYWLPSGAGVGSPSGASLGASVGSESDAS